TEELLDEVRQAEAPAAHEAGGGHGVEDGLRDESPRAVHEAQVVIAPVQDQGVAAYDLEQRLQIQSGKGVHEQFTTGVTELKEAQLLGIGVEAVRLRVHGEPAGVFEFAQCLFQPLGSIDHVR